MIYHAQTDRVSRMLWNLFVAAGRDPTAAQMAPASLLGPVLLGGGAHQVITSAALIAIVASVIFGAFLLLASALAPIEAVKKETGAISGR